MREPAKKKYFQISFGKYLGSLGRVVLGVEVSNGWTPSSEKDGHERILHGYCELNINQ